MIQCTDLDQLKEKTIILFEGYNLSDPTLDLILNATSYNTFSGAEYNLKTRKVRIYNNLIFLMPLKYLYILEELDYEDYKEEISTLRKKATMELLTGDV